MSLAENPQCLKIAQKVAFNIASEASYVYILSGQKLIKNAKKWSILTSFWKPKACGQTVLPERTKIGGTCQSPKIQMRHFDIFSNSILGFFMIFEHCVMFTKWFLDLNLCTLLFALKS